jgi:hypothetical protein
MYIFFDNFILSISQVLILVSKMTCRTLPHFYGFLFDKKIINNELIGAAALQDKKDLYTGQKGKLKRQTWGFVVGN